MRTDRWRYLRWDNGNEELYDHAADPNEWHNLLHPSNATLAAGLDLPALKAELAAYFPAINRQTEEGAKVFGGASVKPRDEKSKEEVRAERQKKRQDEKAKANATGR